MDILMVNNFVEVTGGADRHCLDLAVGLRAAGHTVRFVATATAEEESESGVRVPLLVTNSSRDRLSLGDSARVATQAIWNRTAYAATVQAIDEVRPDVVHVHKSYPQLSVAPVVAASRLNVPIVQTAHDYEFVSASPEDANGRWRDTLETRARYRALNTALFQIKERVHIPAVTRWVVASRAMARSYRRVGIDVTVLPLFAVSEPSAGMSITRRSGIVFAGRLAEHKGVLDVIALASLLPNEAVRIAGTGALESRVRTAAMTMPNLDYLGRLGQAEMTQELARCKVCVIPSRWEEPGGLVALEAMAVGTPIVAYRAGGLAEYVIDANAGIVTPRRNAECLARASLEILTDDEGWAGFSQRGLWAAQVSHSVSGYVERLCDIYLDAAGQDQR